MFRRPVAWGVLILGSAVAAYLAFRVHVNMVQYPSTGTVDAPDYYGESAPTVSLPFLIWAAGTLVSGFIAKVIDLSGDRSP